MATGEIPDYVWFLGVVILVCIYYIYTLKNQTIDQQKKRLKSQADEISRYEQKVANLTSTISSLKQKITSLETSVTNLQAEKVQNEKLIANKKATIDQLNKTKAMQEQQLKDVRAQLVRSQAANDKLEAENKRLQSDGHAKAIKITSLQGKVSQLEVSLKAEQKEKTLLAAAKALLEKEKAALDVQIAKLEQTIINLQGQVKGRDAQIDALKNEKAELIAAKEKLSVANVNLDHKIQTLHGTITSLREQVTLLGQEKAEALAEKATVDKQLLEANAKIKKITAEKTDALMELNMVQAELEQLKKRLGSTTVKVTHLTDEVAHLKHTKSELEKAKADLETNVTALGVQLKTEQTQNAEKTAEIVKLNNKILALEKESAGKSKQITNLNNRVTQLEGDLQNKADALKAEVAKSDKLELEKAKLMKEVENIQEIAANYKAQLDDAVLRVKAKFPNHRELSQVLAIQALYKKAAQTGQIQTCSYLKDSMNGVLKQILALDPKKVCQDATALKSVSGSPVELEILKQIISVSCSKTASKKDSRLLHTVAKKYINDMYQGLCSMDDEIADQLSVIGAYQAAAGLSDLNAKIGSNVYGDMLKPIAVLYTGSNYTGKKLVIDADNVGSPIKLSTIATWCKKSWGDLSCWTPFKWGSVKILNPRAKMVFHRASGGTPYKYHHPAKEFPSLNISTLERAIHRNVGANPYSGSGTMRRTAALPYTYWPGDLNISFEVGSSVNVFVGHALANGLPSNYRVPHMAVYPGPDFTGPGHYINPGAQVILKKKACKQTFGNMDCWDKPLYGSARAIKPNARIKFNRNASGSNLNFNFNGREIPDLSATGLDNVTKLQFNGNPYAKSTTVNQTVGLPYTYWGGDVKMIV